MRGKVAYADGVPAIGYTVATKAIVSESIDDEGRVGRGFSIPMGAVVDSNGFYEFKTLSPNFRYVAWLLRPDGKHLQTFEGETPPLAPGATHTWDLSLIDPIRVTGAVYVAGTKEAMPRAAVWAKRVGGEPMSFADFNQDGGEYELSVPEPGKYLIYPVPEVTFDLFDSTELANAEVNGKTVDLKPGDDIHVDLELPASFVLPVRVVNDKGEVEPTARIELSWPSEDGQWTRTERELDAEGRYVWYCQPGREIWVCAVADKFHRACTQHLTTEAGVRAPEQVLVLGPSAGIRANIVIPENLKIEGGILLRVTYKDGSTEDMNSTMYGAGGEYIANDGIRAGTISVAAVEIGDGATHVSQSVECTVSAGELYDVGDLVMQSAAGY